MGKTESWVYRIMVQPPVSYLPPHDSVRLRNQPSGYRWNCTTGVAA